MSASKKSGGNTSCDCNSSSSSSSPCKKSRNSGGGGCANNTSSVNPGCYSGTKSGAGVVQGSLSGKKSREDEVANDLKQKCGFSDKCAKDAAKKIFDKIQDHFDTLARSPNSEVPAGNYDDDGCFIGGNCEFSICSDTPVDITITCNGDNSDVNVGPVTDSEVNHNCGTPWEPPGGWPADWDDIYCDPYPPPPDPTDPGPI